MSFIDHYPTDEEDEGLDSEEVNFNEMVLEDEARLAVRNKRGRRFERIEFSNRLCIPGDVQCTLYRVHHTFLHVQCAYFEFIIVGIAIENCFLGKDFKFQGELIIKHSLVQIILFHYLNQVDG